MQGVAQMLLSHDGFQGLWLAIERGLRKGNQGQTCHEDESKNLFHTNCYYYCLLLNAKIGDKGSKKFANLQFFLQKK